MLLLICAGLVELSFRVYHYFSPSYIFNTDSYHRFRPKPFTYHWNFRLNSRGYLDTEFEAEKGDTYRILGIGDSFTRGAVPYEHNFLTRLEDQLKQRNPSIEILNLGIAGTGPKEYLAQLMEEGLVLAPDLVLLSFFTGNDFTEIRRDSIQSQAYSYLVSFIRFALKIRPRYLAEMARYCDDCPTFDQDRFLAIEGARASGKHGTWFGAFRIPNLRTVENSERYRTGVLEKQLRALASQFPRGALRGGFKLSYPNAVCL